MRCALVKMQIKAINPNNVTRRQHNLVAFLLILPSLYFVALFFYIALQRIGYPMELELIEGSPVNHALRILQGEALYVAPSFEFTPNLYTPLFYYCGAALSYLMGIGFVSMRAVSVLATLVTFVVIALFVRRETRSTVAAFTATGLYAATYAASGGWMDLARVDSLFVVLLLCAVYWMRYAKNTLGVVVSAILFLLAFYAKQSALIAAAPLMFYAVLVPAPNTNRFVLPMVFIGLLLFSLGIVDWMTDRWFTYYTLVMPAGHPNNSNNMREFWRHDLIQVMPIAIACSLIVIGNSLVNKNKKDVLFFAILVFAFALTAYLTRINKGGYYNNLMPVYAALAIVFGVFIGKTIESLSSSRFFVIATVIAVMTQFWFLNYDPYDFIPHWEDWNESERLLNDVRAIDGNIYALDYGFIGYLAGKKNFSHSTALGDIRLSRYQYWAGIDLHSLVEQQMAMMMGALDYNKINGLVLVNESSAAPENKMGNFVLKEHYAGVRHATAWSQETFWVRSWSTRTMFLRPDTLLYVRE